MEFHEYVTQMLEGFRLRPLMWAQSNDALELGALLLVMSEVQHYVPDGTKREPRIVMEAFIREKQRLLPQYPSNGPLSSFVSGNEFHDQLAEIIRAVRISLGVKFGLPTADLK
jgi:hypothetical protein